mmetsp:Transcript_13058/g.45656  ORF Transcript_13058/g.45656 Transcript_13058/m.45656 type:complete len:170 (-) Transcript_13058:183-692(-)
MVALDIPASFGYVIIINICLSGLNNFLLLGGLVMKARAAARKDYAHLIDYPMMQAYVDPTDKDTKKRELAFKFNSAQRGHYNAVETIGNFLAMSIVVGLFHPITTAVLGAVWNVGTYVYAKNYAENGPKSRYSGLGGLGRLGFFGLFLIGVITGVELAFPQINLLAFLP